MVGSLPLLSEGEHAIGLPPNGHPATRCKKSFLNSDECFPRRTLNGVDFYTFGRTHLKPFPPTHRSPAPGKRSSSDLWGVPLNPIVAFPYRTR